MERLSETEKLGAPRDKVELCGPLIDADSEKDKLGISRIELEVCPPLGLEIGSESEKLGVSSTKVELLVPDSKRVCVAERGDTTDSEVMDTILEDAPVVLFCARDKLALTLIDEIEDMMLLYTELWLEKSDIVDDGSTGSQNVLISAV